MKHSENPPTSNRLSVSLFVWALIVCALPNFILAFTEQMTLFQRLTNALLPVGIWWMLLSLSRKVGRSVLWMFPVMFFAAFQIVLVYLYGRSVIAVDMFLNLVTTNPGEVGELLGNLGPIIVTVIVLYLPPITAGVIACVRRWRLPERFVAANRKLGMILTAAGALCLVVGLFSSRPYRPLKDLYPLNVMCNVGIAIDRTARMADYAHTSEAYTFASRMDVQPDSLRRIVVLVVGETTRSDHWQINGYERPTSPELMGDSAFISFHKALSESNTTHKSVPMLLSHLSADSFADSIYNVKSVVTAFGEAGYRTAFFSNQRYNHSFIDSFGFEADTTVFIKELDGKDHFDHELAGLLASEVERGDSLLLVVLHTYGSHFSYADRYPGDAARFVPDGPLEATGANRDVLVNAFDNTVAYTSALLDSVAEILSRSEAVASMIYASDHGEDIFDDSRGLFLHASPAPSAYQIHVPVIMWFSQPFAGRYPELIDAARSNAGKNVSSSQSFFHTALQLGGLVTAVSDSTLSLVSTGYAEPSRRYLNDHNEGVDLGESGFQAQDFERLDSLGISR
ncbi:MAG: lipid A phosphoethanolamine transferase [Bacteroides sp.]|nr:lipid A phosphoethanolamine transferase [Bacteroides sp.]